MPQAPRPFPSFTVEDAEQGRVSIALSTGESVSFQVENISSPIEVVPLEHPDFMAMLAVLLWVRSKGTNIGDVFRSPELMAEYFVARWTPLEVTA